MREVVFNLNLKVQKLEEQYGGIEGDGAGYVSEIPTIEMHTTEPEAQDSVSVSLDKTSDDYGAEMLLQKINCDIDSVNLSVCSNFEETG